MQQGMFPAGGGIERTFGLLRPEVASQLRVLWTTPSYTSHAIAAHPRVPAADIAKIKKAMDDMTRDPQGLRLLAAIGFNGFESAVSSADWDDIRRLHINPADARIEPEPAPAPAR